MNLLLNGYCLLSSYTRMYAPLLSENDPWNG